MVEEAIVNTTTYGGISPVDLPEWQAVRDTTPISPLTLNHLRRLRGRVTIGLDQPNLGLTTQPVFDKIKSLSETFLRLGAGDLAQIGFQTIVFEGAEIAVDPQIPTTDATAQRFYWLNERYISLYINKNENFRVQEFEYNPQQLGYISHILVMLNLCCSQRRKQAVYTAINPNT